MKKKREKLFSFTLFLLLVSDFTILNTLVSLNQLRTAQNNGIKQKKCYFVIVNFFKKPRASRTV